MSSRDVEMDDRGMDDDDGLAKSIHTPVLRVPGVAVDMAICGLLGAIGLWFLIGGLGMKGGKAAIGPGTVPAITGGCLMALSALQIGLAVLRRARLPVVEFQRPLWLVLGMVLIILFPSAVDEFGYFPVAVIWVPVFGWVVGIRSPVGLVVATAIVLALAKFVFEMLLGTPLP
ncbi:MAG: hypothetical protein GC186_15440 [Rhodobacteraceae bacterium]|nr:hypothetical protein [Paracoccaceae bacterium]